MNDEDIGKYLIQLVHRDLISLRKKKVLARERDMPTNFVQEKIKLTEKAENLLKDIFPEEFI